MYYGWKDRGGAVLDDPDEFCARLAQDERDARQTTGDARDRFDAHERVEITGEHVYGPKSACEHRYDGHEPPTPTGWPVARSIYRRVWD